MSTALAVFDLDGTITRRDSLAPYLAGYLRDHPARAARLPLALPAMLSFILGRADRGVLKGSLLHYLLGGLNRAEVSAWSERFTPQLVRHGLFGEALDAIGAHRKAGDRLVLLSASVDLYVPLVGRALGFDEVICSRARWGPGERLDGRLDGPNCRGEEKVRQLQELLRRLQPTHTTAYGNSSADLPHMELADQGIYVNGPGGKIGPNIRRVKWSRRT